ncbi:hypothetical protein [Sutcliffiella cohnii]|uniref:hypothetical protein n=1 Tax=Sutcliffiella cohnii TaxID=33932 RepID=UPI002E1A783E|nr:hypothetical protein [Sutcliffiella cohnii]
MEREARNLSRIKYDHINDIINSLEEKQKYYKQLLKENNTSSSLEKTKYIEGLVDGINLMLEPLKKYNEEE